MGIKRIVDTSFWTDGKVDDFSPEDKYFMLYLLTSPFSSQLGIYEISIKQVAFQLGYSVDAVKVLIERFENKYRMIFYSPQTNEIAVKNYLRHSIIKGGAPVRDCLIKEIKKVKNKELVSRVFAHVKNSESLNETVKKIIAEYEEKNGVLIYTNKKNDNENENENDNEVSSPVSYNDTLNDTFNQIVSLYHSICISFSKVLSLTDERKETITESLNTYTVEDFKTVFAKAEASSFLKGVDGGWNASFDWLIVADNMLKVLEDKYADKPKRYGRTEVVPSWMNAGNRQLDEDEIAAINRMLEKEPGAAERAAIRQIMAENPESDPAVEAEAEQLRQMMQEKYGK